MCAPGYKGTDCDGMYIFRGEGRVLPIWLKVTKVKRLFIQLVFNFISFKLDDEYYIFLIYPQV